MKNTIKLSAITALMAAIGLMTVMGCKNDSDKDDANGEHWLISSQKTSTVKDGILDSNYSYTSYSWIAYNRNGTDYEEKYTTGSSSPDSGSPSFYSEHHNTRNGQTSLSTTETISRYYNQNTGVHTLSPTTSSTTATYDSASGLTSSSTTVSSAGTTTTYYSIALLIDLNGAKTYQHTPVGGNWYNIIKIQDGRTLETSYYNEQSGLISTTTYIQPDNAEIRSKLPNFTLYSTRYFLSASSIINSYQTAEVLPWEEPTGSTWNYDWDGLTIRVKTFNDSVLSSQTDYTYAKRNPNVSLNPEGIEYEYLGGGVWSGYGFELKRWGDYWYGENGKIYLWTGTGSNVVIPEQINGKPVTGIEGVSKPTSKGAFANCYKLTGVTIPNSVTSIGGGMGGWNQGAFGNCWSLANVTIGNSVTSIGSNAFRNCYSLASVTIPNSVTSIAYDAFSNCYNLTNLTIGNGVTSIERGSFSGAPLTSVTFQGTIPRDGFVFDEYGYERSLNDPDLVEKYLEGGPGTYTRPSTSNTWTKQGGNGGGSNPSDGTGWTTVTDSNIGTWPFYAIAFDNGKFVAGVYGDKISTSTDGVTWTAAANIGITTMAIAYGNGKFVAGGHGGAMSYSSDGITWTPITNVPFGASADIMAIAYGNGKFVVGGTTGSNTVYSSDGITWQAVANSILGTASLGGSAAVSAIAYGNSKFVAAGNGKAATSTDGVTWTAAASIDNSSEAIAYGDGKFVIVGMYGKMVYSADGATWTPVTDSTFGTSNIHTIAYGGGKFVAGGNDGKMATSPDGVTWTAITDNPFLVADPTYSSVQTIAYGNGKFVVGGTTDLTDVNLSGKMACLSDN